MIKLIASDVDGTLVKDGTLMINPEYMNVINTLVDKGIIFVVCSGRQFVSERKLFAPIADKLYYISDGGTVVRTPDKILKTFPMDEELWKGMCRMVRDTLPSCDYFVGTPDYGYAEDAGCSTGSVTPMDLTFARQVMCSQSRMRTSSNLPSIIQTNVKNSAPRNLSLIGKSMPRSQPPAKNGWIAMHSGSANGRLSPTLWSILESLPMRCAYSATT